MFPLRWNFPFRKKDGSMSTIEEVISEGGGGGGYTLPTASAETKGGIKIGAGLSMDGEVLNNTNPTPPTPYTLPTASADTLGGVKVGANLSIDENGVLSSTGGGGVTIKSQTVSVSTVIPAKSFVSVSVQSTVLYNKTILGLSSPDLAYGACFTRLRDLETPHTVKDIGLILFNASSNQLTTSEIYVTYID